MNGYITLDKKILEWEWYKSHNELIVFIHLLLTCNYEPKTWRGIKINRGQIITSYESLSNQTGLSIRSVRTAISNLKLTGELTSKATNQFSLLTICKYDDYQSKNKKTDKQTAKPTDKPKAKPTDRLTDKPTNNNIKNINKEKESTHTPPFNGLGVDARTWCEGVIYFSSKEDPGQKMAKKIYSHYKKDGFLYKGKLIDRRNYDEAIQSYLNTQNS